MTVVSSFFFVSPAFLHHVSHVGSQAWKVKKSGNVEKKSLAVNGMNHLSVTEYQGRTIGTPKSKNKLQSALKALKQIIKR